ncbi:hypothetical protein [Tychonema sp. LEGE 07203]|uniref:hypothetical protein n=1 Tax=Tychonema sp. LEGE 07203 TaxID=1828671 RepID=UPI00187FC93F|nr:hypothetical protein [Tychonema sp. LEGE 07203]MBE9095179.1 hypothetical protein [Tychonema sp. LEGE 07203]
MTKVVDDKLRLFDYQVTIAPTAEAGTLDRGQKQARKCQLPVMEKFEEPACIFQIYL